MYNKNFICDKLHDKHIKFATCRKVKCAYRYRQNLSNNKNRTLISDNFIVSQYIKKHLQLFLDQYLLALFYACLSYI